MIVGGIALYSILKILAVGIGVCAIIWYYLKFVSADDAADKVENFGGKLLDIFGLIIKYLFYAIVFLVILIIVNNT